MHKAAVNNQPLDKAVGAAAVRQVLLDRQAAVAVLKQVVAVDRAAVAAVAEDNQLTLPRQALETFARCYTTGAGIWACCAAKRKSI